MADETMAAVEECLGRLEKALGLPDGFIEGLAKEDDWSFLIKASALLEAALASLISAHLNSAELRRPLSYLEMGHPKYGKIALTEALGLTVPEERRFLRAVGELRNLCAHRVENISFSLVSYVASLDENQRKSFATAIGYFNLREDRNGRLYEPRRESRRPFGLSHAAMGSAACCR